MSHIISFLSGQVPGGIFLLALVLFVVNLVFVFSRSSKLLSARESKKRQKYASLIIVILYLLPWILLQPPRPVKRIVILPSAGADKSQPLKAASFAFGAQFENTARANLSKEYILQRWEWLYETIGKDSAVHYSAWVQMAQRLKPDILIKTQENKDRLQCTLVLPKEDSNSEKVYSVPLSAGYQKLLAKINEDFGLFKEFPHGTAQVSEFYINVRLAILQQQTDRALKLLKDYDTAQADILRGEIFARKGLMHKFDRVKAKYVPLKIKEFDTARKYFSRVIREKKDTPDVAFWLGRMALHLQDYTRAEIYLKNALLGDPQNSRIYLRLSYLNLKRLKELGFKNRVDILAKAVYYDPGFKLAVQELADEYFMSGSGARSAKETALAKKVLQDYLNLKKNDAHVLSLMGSLYIKLAAYDKALAIYSDLYKRFPDESNSSYNLGVVYFMKKDYPRALDYFLQAIKTDNNPDAYLYAGITYQRMGKKALALDYYRKRVRLKSGEDDFYAKEAMKGIRAILADSLNGAMNETQSDLSKPAAKNK